MRSSTLLRAVLLPGVLLAGCDAAESDHVLSLDATGAVASLVYFDRDGDAKFTLPTDAPLPGVKVSLRVRGTQKEAAGAVSDAQGMSVIGPVPVGSYDVVVDGSTVGDSVEVLQVESASVTVSALDTAAVLVTFGYPRRTVADARLAPPGKRITVEGIVVSPWSAFGDSTLHLADSTGAVRATRVRPVTAGLGDRVRLLGAVGAQGTVPVLVNPTVVRLGTGELPAPAPVGTGTASRGGPLDAAQVRVSGAAILDVISTLSRDLLLRVDDGSGPLEVVLDVDARITSPVPIARGAVVDISGVTVPKEGREEWQLKPRRSSDLSVTFPTISVASARKTPVGQYVAVEGVALNDLAAFGDLTLHLADATGAIRGIRAGPGPIFAGDSLRLFGALGFRDGQPTVLDPTAAVLGRTSLPAPARVSAAVAAGADGGRLDAAQVAVDGVMVERTAPAGADLIATVSDASGSLEVIVDRDTGIPFGSLSIGSRVDLVGVLVPVFGGAGWRLKPRTPADVVVR